MSARCAWQVARQQLSAADVEQLRTSLAAAERAKGEHERLRAEHARAEEQLRAWRTLFAAEVGDGGDDGAALGVSAEQVKQRLQALRAEQAKGVAAHGATQAELHASQAAASQAQLATRTFFLAQAAAS